jgi:hypothetical protein
MVGKCNMFRFSSSPPAALLISCTFVFQLDLLVDPIQLMWTVGKYAGNFWNSAHLYRSSASLHQYLLACIESADGGAYQARLQKVCLV